MFFIDISCMTLEGFLQKLRRYLTTCSSGTSLSNPLAILEDISNVTLAMDLLAPVGYLGLLLVRNSVRSVSPRNPRERFFSSLKMHPQKNISVSFFCLIPCGSRDLPPWKLTYPHTKALLKMIFPFPNLGYVNFFGG